MRRHKLGEVKIECTLHNSVVWAIFMPKIAKFNESFTKL